MKSDDPENELRRFAQHLPTCPAIASTDGPNAPYPCTCGFEKVASFADHRRKRLPVAQTGMRSTVAIIEELIMTLEAQGSKYLIGTYMGGWEFSIKRSADNGRGES